jgi:hypothetical protein
VPSRFQWKRPSELAGLALNTVTRKALSGVHAHL